MLSCLLVASFAGGPLSAADQALFDAHIHYSLDARDYISPQQVLERLRAAGIRHALVSSSGDVGTQELYALAPDLVIPSLRPYRAPGESGSWMHDESVIDFMERRLRDGRYAAIGEFHVYGSDVDLPVVIRVIELARDHGLPLHVHGDAEAIEGVFRHDPAARVLWAHAGFEAPARVDALMRRYPALWAELSMRSDVAVDGRISESWRRVLTRHTDRFMVGTDTYTPWRWDEVVDQAAWTRSWLVDLPPGVRQRIMYENGATLFRTWLQSATASRSASPRRRQSPPLPLSGQFPGWHRAELVDQKVDEGSYLL